ncbi:hypothetical protein GIB67_039291 [Kingdonia uniflora]|nr:hypothetical protein GIB67_039291 [Kingdonia uniflora]
MSLCKTSRLDESINVLKGMNGTGLGCLPNSESYGVVIGAMCGERRTKEAMWLMREMVRVGVMPRQGTVCRVVAALRRDKEIRRATEMVEMLERKGVSVGFEGYEILVEGCLERREFVLAGKVVMDMVERKGFVPYIGVRQRVVKGLVGIGKADFASVVRQKLVGVLS